MLRFLIVAAVLLLAACGPSAVSGPSSSEGNGALPQPDPPTAWQKETFGSLAELVGKTFLGGPGGDSSEQTADVQYWSWAVGGSVLSITHALEDGSYGGETLVYRDNSTDGLAYVYVTDGGFMTQGSFTLDDEGGWVAEEEVTGHPTITKVRSTGVMKETGELVSTSEYFQNGEWVAGNNFTYREVVGRRPEFDAPG